MAEKKGEEEEETRPDGGGNLKLWLERDRLVVDQFWSKETEYD